MTEEGASDEDFEGSTSFWQSMHEHVCVRESFGSQPGDAIFSNPLSIPAALLGHRRTEFAAGRICAGEALRALGVEPTRVARGTRGEPIWPPGTVGSISHTDDYRVAIVAPQRALLSIGIDAEAKRQLTDRTVRRVCSEAELEQIRGFESTQRVIAPLIYLSAKESLFKCVYQLSGTVLGWHDSTLRLDWARRNLTVQSLQAPAVVGSLDAFTGRFAVLGRHVLTGFAVPRSL